MLTHRNPPSRISRTQSIVLLVGFLLLLLAHGVALIYRIQPVVSLWFPPSGVAIVLTFWLGPVGVALTWIASFLVAPVWGNGGWARFASITDALEPLIAWLLYCRYFRGSFSLGSLRDVIAFITSVPLAACGTSAILGSLILVAFGRLSLASLPESIPHWWLGNAIGAMTIVPVMLLCVTPHLQRRGWLPATESHQQMQIVPPLQYQKLEVGLIILTVIATSWLTVYATQISIFTTLQFALLSSIPVIWAATRFGLQGGVLIASFSILVSLCNYLVLYPNAILLPQFPVSADLLHTHKLSLLLQAIIALLIGAIMTERAATQVALATEQVRSSDYQAQAQFSDKLLLLNRSLQEVNQQLQESEALFRTSIENMLDCFGVYSAVRDSQGGIIDFQIEYVNDAACVNNQLTREQQLGKMLCELLPGHRSSGLFDEYCRVVETGQPLVKDSLVYGDEYGKRKLIRAFDIRVAKFGDGFIATWRDITERKHAESDRQKLISLIESSSDFISLSDPEGRMTFVNEAGRALVGLDSLDAVKQTTILDYFSEDDRAYIQSHVLPIVQEQGSWQGELQFRHFQNGTFIPILANSQVIKDTKTGEVIALASVSRDISERKQIETNRSRLLEREQAARQQAEAASRMKDEFLAIVSHELRSPLNGILGWSRLLRTRKLDAGTTEKALASIERNAQAQTQLIEDLLDISRIIRGTVRLNMRPVSLIPIMQAALDTVRPTAEAKSIHLETQLSPDSGLVAGDSDRLQQVVWNLLSNAVKFTPEGGQVNVTLQRSGSQVRIQVTDTGKGISAEFLPHVFDRFRQADATTTRTQGGLGLGLAIVRNLVELHGGTVWAESVGEGQGATFIAELPLLPDGNQQTNENFVASSSGYPDSLAGLKVLIVDDEADTREFLATALEQFGSIVTVATSASEAFALFQQTRPDVLLSDIGMPEEDGYTLIKKIRALPPSAGGQTPAAALTAYVRGDDRLQALEAGFQMHVPKPIEPIQLVHVVAKLAEPS